MPKKLDASQPVNSLSIDDPVFRRREAAQYLGVSTIHYDRIVRTPDGPRVFRMGRNVCTRRSWLNAYIERYTSSKVA